MFLKVGIWNYFENVVIPFSSSILFVAFNCCCQFFKIELFNWFSSCNQNIQIILQFQVDFFYPFYCYSFRFIFFNLILFHHIQHILSKVIRATLPHDSSSKFWTLFFNLSAIDFPSSCSLTISVLNNSNKHKRYGSIVEVKALVSHQLWILMIQW